MTIQDLTQVKVLLLDRVRSKTLFLCQGNELQISKYVPNSVKLRKLILFVKIWLKIYQNNMLKGIHNDAGTPLGFRQEDGLKNTMLPQR